MLREEKASVRDFYEGFGWSTDSTGTYNDTAAFVDLRPVLGRYYRDTQNRVGRFLERRGGYFLDAGSGPISQPESVLYSAGYRYRVCFDLSSRALAEARARLDAHGLYVCGDLANLPFRDGCFDTILCSHVLYHVPEDEQAGALREMYRTLRRGGTCAVIYIWPRALRLRGFTSAPEVDRAVPPLYFHPHEYKWMRRALPRQWKTDVRVWRSVGIGFTRRLIADNVLGAVLLRIVYWLEEAFPHALARLGRYPLILIRKSESG